MTAGQGVWQPEPGPTAAGWLGGTAGVTADDRLVRMDRFASVEAAGQWWEAVEIRLDGRPTVLETQDVTLQRAGDPAVARFVQVMRATVRDRERFEAVEERIGPRFLEQRPDFLGGFRLWFAGGSIVAVDYFRSEAEARAGEAKPMPDDLVAGFGEWQSLIAEPEWFDLTDPWLVTPV